MTNLLEDPMAKQNKTKGPFQVKLPGEYHQPLQKAEALSGRPMSVSVQVALELYFRLMGIPFRPNWPELQIPDRPPTR